jgi:hypothetical protein
MRTSRSFIVAALLALLLSACGRPSDPMSDADVQAFKGFSTSYQQVATEMLALRKAVADKRLPAARASLDTLGAELHATDGTVRAVRNRTVHALLADYMRITRRAIAAIDDLVTHLESAPNQAPSRDVLAEIETSDAQIKEADGNLVGRILDQAASDHQKRAIEQAITIER